MASAIQIPVSEALISQLGTEQIEQALLETIERLKLRQHIPDMIAELATIDIEDEAWQAARKSARKSHHVAR